MPVLPTTITSIKRTINEINAPGDVERSVKTGGAGNLFGTFVNRASEYGDAGRTQSSIPRKVESWDSRYRDTAVDKD